MRKEIKRSKYHTRVPPKCKYCDMEAKRNIRPDRRNKGYYRTCGNQKCLTEQYRDKAVCARKRLVVQRICKKCGNSYTTSSSNQSFCLICAPDKTSRARLKRYNISAFEFAEMLKQQDGKCAICRSPDPDNLDHCHITNRVRGILCSKCNHGLHFIEDEIWVEKAKRYVTVSQQKANEIPCGQCQINLGLVG